jgi:hypothetical protein
MAISSKRYLEIDDVTLHLGERKEPSTLAKLGFSSF